jgi:hypothetical protein
MRRNKKEQRLGWPLLCFSFDFSSSSIIGSSAARTPRCVFPLHSLSRSLPPAQPASQPADTNRDTTPRTLLSFYSEAINNENDSATELDCRIATAPFPSSKARKNGRSRLYRIGVLPDLVCRRTICTVSPCPRFGRDWHLNPNSTHASSVGSKILDFFSPWDPSDPCDNSWEIRLLFPVHGSPLFKYPPSSPTPDPSVELHMRRLTSSSRATAHHSNRTRC